MKILWASPNALLDSCNGAALMVRECLHQLALRGCAVRILGGTVFVNPEGMAGRETLWTKLRAQKGQFVDLKDGVLTHRLLVTEQPQRRLLFSYEEQRWFDEYCRQLEVDPPDLVLFFDNSLITLLTAGEARRRGIASGVFLMHANNRGRTWCRDVDWMFTDTRATAQMYLDREGYRMLPVGTFVNPQQVKAASCSRENLLFVNPIPAKGAMVFVQLALWLSRHRPDIPIEVLDSRKSWHLLLQQIGAVLGVSVHALERVRVTPNTPDMRPVYGRARLLLVPSLWWESGARVVVEALINGIPVIGSDSGGIPEILAGGGEVLEIPAECRKPPYLTPLAHAAVESLAARVCRYWDDAAFYRAASERALQAHAQAHDLIKNGDALKVLLERCVREGLTGQRL